MPRPNINAERSKDFKGSILRLFKSLDKWRFLMILAIVLSIIAAVLSTIAPNRLAGITDVISDGIKPNTEGLTNVSEEIIATAVPNYLVKNNDPKLGMNELIERYVSLPLDEKIKYLEGFTYDGVYISVEDQKKFLTLMEDSNLEMGSEGFLPKLDQLPESIKGFVEPKMDIDKLKILSIILAIIYLLNSIFTYAEGIIMSYVGIGFSKKLRNDISLKINRLPLRYFDRHETGDILSRVTNDVDTIGINMSSNVTSLIANITLFLGSIVMMFVTNWIMACTAIAASVLGFVFSFLLLKRSQKYFVQRQEELGKLNGHIEEIYSGHNVVKAYNGEKEALKEFDSINRRLYMCNLKSQFLSGIMQPIMGFIGNIGYVAVCVVGALLVMNHQTGFGVIVAFMIYVRLFTNPLTRIAQALTTMQSIAAAGERVFEFMDEAELTSEKNLIKKLDKNSVKGNIEFKNVKFGYDEGKDIIKKFTASVSSGEKIAIVGPTGAGKTTMVNLLMKFYEINDGDILIDGVSIKDLTRENIHDLFIMVLQDTWLFDGSIRDNLIFNHKKVSDDKLWDICKNVGVDHFVKTLPGGLDASVGESNSISSGQKQLLTIARGMVEDAPFLILDEATSNVDTRTEELVQKAMDKLMVGRTSFIIAHRLSTIKNANLILVMDNGNIVEQGTHEELLKKNGFYAKLYRSQFQK